MSSASTSVTSAVARAFAGTGALATGIPGYEPRQAQQDMAAAVAHVIEQSGTLLVEAGTGTGKTLAYLVPAILSRQRVLISTGTKNLQEQIFFKDIPALRAALGVSFTATLMKGRGNYLCLHRWEMFRDGVIGQTSAGGRLIESGDQVLVPIIDDWLKQTREGDRAELRELPEDLSVWRDIAAEADSCLGSECPRYGDCFVTLMRQRAAESDVVIVNHHLLCADAAVRQSEYGEVIPACPTLVVDEAHQLEDVATQYFGYGFSDLRVEDLLRDVVRQMGAWAGSHVRHDIDSALAHIRDRARLFQVSVAALASDRVTESRMRYTGGSSVDLLDSGAELEGAIERLEGLMNRAAAPGDRDRGPGEIAGAEPSAAGEGAAALARRAHQLRTDLQFLLRASDPGYVFFLERRGRGLSLRAAPIEVAAVMRDTVLERFRAVVLTSATMTVDRSFSYVKSRLGIRHAAELRVESEFDFASQALLYLPRSMPAPRQPEFGPAAAREAIEILKCSRGRAFLLFTSYAILREVQRFVEMALPYPLLVQGTAPRSSLIETFRCTPHAVLLGTASFWQGVDVVGSALSCVIIDKLPFVSPADPIVAARIDALRDAGGDPFSDYQIPLAILTLQQGLGRLIRHRGDRGVLAILDPRLRTMGYGRKFLASLPPAPVTYDIAAVERFFK